MLPPCRLLPLVVTLACLVGCGSSSSSGGSAAFIGTEGGELTSGTGSITAIVVDSCLGTPLADVQVWIGDDTTNIALTDVDGRATLSQVAGSSSARLISAGKPGWSLASILTTATSVRLALERTNVTTTTISGTVNFLGSQTMAEVDVLEGLLGVQSQMVSNTGGTATFTITVPTGIPFTLSVTSRDANNVLDALTVGSIPALSSASTGHVLDLPAASAAQDLGQVQLDLPAGFDTGNLASGAESVCRSVFFTSIAGVVSGDTAVISSFRVPHANVLASLPLDLRPYVFAFSANSLGREQASLSFPLSALGSSLTFSTLQVGLSLSGGSRPTVTLTSGLTAGTGYHEVLIGRSAGLTRQRLWSFYLSGDTRSFDVPLVPSALADEGLVTGVDYLAVVSGYVTPVADFDSFDLSAVQFGPSQTVVSNSVFPYNL